MDQLLATKNMNKELEDDEKSANQAVKVKTPIVIPKIFKNRQQSI